MAKSLRNESFRLIGRDLITLRRRGTGKSMTQNHRYVTLGNDKFGGLTKLGVGDDVAQDRGNRKSWEGSLSKKKKKVKACSTG